MQSRLQHGIWLFYASFRILTDIMDWKFSWTLYKTALISNLATFWHIIKYSFIRKCIKLAGISLYKLRNRIAFFFFREKKRNQNWHFQPNFWTRELEKVYGRNRSKSSQKVIFWKSTNIITQLKQIHYNYMDGNWGIICTWCIFLCLV